MKVCIIIHSAPTTVLFCADNGTHTYSSDIIQNPIGASRIAAGYTLFGAAVHNRLYGA
jgi:hypothetical protein